MPSDIMTLETEGDLSELELCREELKLVRSENIILKAKLEKIAEVAFTSKVDTGAPWCPGCENRSEPQEMIMRQNRSNGNLFWGCPAFPRCKTTLQYRPMVPQVKKEQVEVSKEQMGVSHADSDRVTRAEMAEVARSFKELLRGKTPCKTKSPRDMVGGADENGYPVHGDQNPATNSTLTLHLKGGRSEAKQ